MAVPAPTQPDLVNAGFEDGDLTGWSTEQTGGTGTAQVSVERPFAGSYSAQWLGASGSGHAGGVECVWFNDATAVVTKGDKINAQVYISLDDTGSSQNRGEIRIYWYDEDGDELDYAAGLLIRGNSEAYKVSSINATAPTGAVTAKLAVWTTANSSGGVFFDNATWDYTYDAAAELVNPPDGATYSETDVIPLSVSVTGTDPAPVSVTYMKDSDTLGSSSVGPNYNLNAAPQAAGTYAITAVVLFEDGSEITTTAHNITVTATPPEPITREFKASNSYTFMVAENISGIGSAIPSVARVTAVEAVVDYQVDALIRSADIGVSDPTASNPNVLFDITDGGTLQMIMVQADDGEYTKIGSTYEAAIPLDRASFSITEEGTSEGKKWTVMEDTGSSTTIGSDVDLFGQSAIAASDFLKRGFAFRFIPNLLSKPAYADSGDGVFRFKIDKLRLRVYFDAGSVEYYFASPDKTNVLKGNLVGAYVTSGNFETGDAAGDLQITSDLEVVDGEDTYISCNWTIHAAYPPTDENQIGEVACEEGSSYGMTYNGLPTQQQVRENRSRYEIITANFYGDKALNSMYGAHGLDRAFAFNGDWFYKIYTQPDPEKDQPRHLAYHHSHLALGYEEGRVDISVAGSPWNFDGELGATSFAIGDAVVGLLELSGTILGVFGAKSVWGISGTVADNFSTQVISPNIGATEYTICDMGFPVYANAYGIYTLSQIQQYGDYLGQPMSQDISPWLRPRLVRKLTTPAEVVVAWPVRSKNQYRLAFSDGYVLSMTLNGQAIPTFSKQKYFYEGTGAEPYISDDLYSYPSIVPAAVSSQLDEGGEERIHIAPYIDVEVS